MTNISKEIIIDIHKLGISAPVILKFHLSTGLLPMHLMELLMFGGLAHWGQRKQNRQLNSYSKLLHYVNMFVEMPSHWIHFTQSNISYLINLI